MIRKRTAACLSGAIVIAVMIHACQAEVIQDNRGGQSQGESAPARKDQDAVAEDKGDGAEANTPAAADDKATPPASSPTNTPPAPAFSLSWDASTDPAVVAYKVFIVPPDRNPRFPGKMDVPIPIKNYPLAALQKLGQKYSVSVSNDEIKAALGTIVVNPTAYCFTLVAVNAVGNSAHSPVICP